MTTRRGRSAARRGRGSCGGCGARSTPGEEVQGFQHLAGEASCCWDRHTCCGSCHMSTGLRGSGDSGAAGWKGRDQRVCAGCKHCFEGRTRWKRGADFGGDQACTAESVRSPQRREDVWHPPHVSIGICWHCLCVLAELRLRQRSHIAKYQCVFQLRRIQTTAHGNSSVAICAICCSLRLSQLSVRLFQSLALETCMHKSVEIGIAGK